MERLTITYLRVPTALHEEDGLKVPRTIGLPVVNGLIMLPDGRIGTAKFVMEDEEITLLHELFQRLADRFENQLAANFLAEPPAS